MPIKRKATDSMIPTQGSGRWQGWPSLGGRSSRASKRATPVPDIQDVDSSDEFSEYDPKEDSLNGITSGLLEK